MQAFFGCDGKKKPPYWLPLAGQQHVQGGESG